jgi:hypothetical protein
MLVLANTMIMAARERTREYAVLKTLGFSAKKCGVYGYLVENKYLYSVDDYLDPRHTPWDGGVLICADGLDFPDLK